MNPELAATLPKYQIACGVTDIMMHTMERYFIPESQCEMTDEIAEGLLRTVIKNGPKVLKTHPITMRWRKSCGAEACHTMD